MARYENTIDTALLTVEEARMKWCPEVRSPDTDDSSTPVCAANRTFAGQGVVRGTECFAASCMAWRWHDASERPQAPSIRIPIKGDENSPMSPVESGRWEFWLDGDSDASFDSMDSLREYIAQDGPDSHLGQQEAEDLWERTNVIAAWTPAPLPPRGYCGKMGHPFAALLLELQVAELNAKAIARRFD